MVWVPFSSSRKIVPLDQDTVGFSRTFSTRGHSGGALPLPTDLGAPGLRPLGQAKHPAISKSPHWEAERPGVSRGESVGVKQDWRRRGNVFEVPWRLSPARPKAGNTGKFFPVFVGFCQFQPSGLTNAGEVTNNHFCNKGRHSDRLRLVLQGAEAAQFINGGFSPWRRRAHRRTPLGERRQLLVSRCRPWRRGPFRGGAEQPLVSTCGP